MKRYQKIAIIIIALIITAGTGIYILKRSHTGTSVRKCDIQQTYPNGDCLPDRLCIGPTDGPVACSEIYKDKFK